MAQAHAKDLLCITSLRPRNTAVSLPLPDRLSDSLERSISTVFMIGFPGRDLLAAEGPPLPDPERFTLGFIRVD